nr:golgin subfamily A member 4 isoform X4 [Gasterosteus aculeatus aculeatus]
MQAQLGPALSHPPMKEPYLSEPPTAAPALGGPPHEVVQKTTSFPSEDSIGAIQEPDSSSAGKPLSLLELEQLSGCRRCNEETAETHQLLKLLESWKYQRDKRSLAVAGGSIQQYQTCFFTLEDFFSKVENPRFRSPCSPLLGTDDHSEADQVTHGMLSQRIDLWTIENGALKQRRQQIINQLIAADREIDKLEAELIGQQGGRQHHTGREELKGELAGKQAYEIDRGYNERELSENALTTLEKLGDTENQPQSNGADYGEEEPNKALLQVANAMVVWMKADPQSAEQRILKLEARNGELMTLNLECETVRRMELREAESKIRMLKEKAEEVERTLGQCVEADDGGLMKQPVTEVERKSGAINQVLQMLAKVAVTVDELLWDLEGTLLGYSKEEPLHVELGMGAGFWNQLLFSSEIQSEEKTDGCAAGLAQQMRAQTRLMLLTRRTSPPAEAEIERVTEQDVAAMYRWLEQETRAFILREKTDTLAAKSNVSTQAASNVKLAKDEQVVSLALTSFASDDEKKRTSQHLWTEAQMSYVISRLEVQQEKELDEKQAELQISRLDCTYCHELWKATKDLQSKLADLQIQPSVASLKSAAGHKASVRGGKPIDAPNRSNELDDAIARHSEELEDVTDGYEQEADTLTLRVPSEENVKEIKSLANGVENIKKRTTPMETFVEEMEELRSTTKPTTPDVNSTDEDPPAQTSPPEEAVRVPADVTQEMRRDITALRLKYQKDLENLKATCERGFTAMEVSHQKVIDELQRKHQRELENLHEEKERLLAEETAATIAAIEAMKNAHRAELEKELDKARKANNNTENADIEEIRRQHEEELCSFQREIEVLSDQYSQKCLENAHLAQALEAERQALRQCQRENQELNAHNQELNNRLAAEITKMRSMASEDGGGDTHTTIQGKELYELEVMLRVKESEVQYLKQEINSLKEELQAAQRDKKYATDKYKDIYTELSIVKAKAERDLGRLRDQLQAAHEALGEASLEEVERGGYDIMKSKSNPDILKMAAAAAKRSERTMRSKSLKEGLTAEQRLHLFENEDAKEF